MYSASTREQAIDLRSHGASYNVICAELSIPKSTLSNWLHGVAISEQIRVRNISAAKLQWAANLRSYNARRHTEYLKNTEERLLEHAGQVPLPNEQELFFLFLGLFWGEGSKKEKFRLSITNTDPALIKACITFLMARFSMQADEFRGCVNVHANNNSGLCIPYWAHITGIPLDRIRSQLVISSASKGKKPIHTLPHGTFVLYINNALLNRQVQGWLRGLRNIYAPE